MNKVYKRNLDTRDEFLARILDAAVRIKQGEDQLEQRAIFAHEFAKCFEVSGGIFEHPL